MSTGHLLLGLLSGQRHHGYDLKHKHDSTFPSARPLAFGQVYATLGRLAKKGHVAAAETEVVDGPERTVYEMTTAGREELDAWLVAVKDPAPFVVNPLATKATIALVVSGPDAARGYLAQQRQAHLERMRYFTRTKTDPEADISTVLAADYALVHLNADLEWLALALERVESLTPDELEEPR